MTSPAPRRPRETVLPAAVDTAHAALVEVQDTAHVGDHLGFELLDDRIGNHYFASNLPGYVGWTWSVTVARAPRARTTTVCEVELVVGEGALHAPDWVPWAERLRPGDLSDTDVLPFVEEDARLIYNYEDTGPDADQLAEWEIGLGRKRVLSDRGRGQAVQRWYDSSQGPSGKTPRRSSASCSSCGFLMLLGGSARTIVGVCANEWSPNDGQVVSLDHGCGAHSETKAPEPTDLWDASPPVRDELDLEVLSVNGRDVDKDS